MTLEDRKKRLYFRATHRGTKEADLLVGGFTCRLLPVATEAEIAWLEALMHEQDVDIMAWAMGKATPPPAFEGPLMDAMRRLDYIEIAR